MDINKTESGYRLEHRGMEVEFMRSRHVVESFACMALDQLIVDAERYRLIRRGQHWSVVDGIGDHLRADALDSAVDKELAAAQKPEGE